MTNTKKTSPPQNSRFYIPGPTRCRHSCVEAGAVNSSSGFTLIEILIVTAIFAVLFGAGLFMSLDFYRSYLLSAERDIEVGALLKARSRALANMFESAHGVHIDQRVYVIFRGGAYLPGDPTNETIPGNIAIKKSGPSDIVFDELSGVPEATGTLTLSDGAKTKVITINSEGRIDW